MKARSVAAGAAPQMTTQCPLMYITVKFRGHTRSIEIQRDFLAMPEFAEHFGPTLCSCLYYRIHVWFLIQIEFNFHPIFIHILKSIHNF